MKTLLPILAVLAFAGCAVQKDLVPTGGSRSDGTVNMSFEEGMFEVPVVDWQRTADRAAQSCAGWGYTGAQAFGGQVVRCEARDGYGNCLRAMVTMTYQCTGAPNGSR